MASDDTSSGGASSHRRWRRAGVSGIVLVAVLLLATTVWLSQGGGSPLAGATGAASPDVPAAASGTPAPDSTTSPQPTPSQAGPGGTAQPAPGEPAPLAELPPVPLSEQVAPVPGVVFGITGLEAVEGVAQGPGEVGGPALRFTLTVRNDTDTAVSVGSTVVNLYAGADQLPMVDLREPGGVPLPESVAAGASVTGVFIFGVPLEERGQVKIGVDYTVGVPIVVFEGVAPQ